MTKEYYVTEAKCSDNTKRGIAVNEIAREYRDAIVVFSDTFTKNDLEAKLRAEILNATSSFKGAEISVELSDYDNYMWYSFKKNRYNVGCIAMTRITTHITE